MKKRILRIYLISILSFSFLHVIAQQQIVRKPILDALLDKQTVSKAEMKQITFVGGQSTPKHLHPCPVLTYVVSGTAIFQEEGGAMKTIHQGEGCYEPKNKTILHYDNASKIEPLVFIAVYLKEGDEEIIKVLEK